MDRTDFEIKICANSIGSCIEARKGGTNRVELCMSIPEGGTTPSCGKVKMAREMLTDTRLHVIIHNRGGGLLYTKQELQHMTMDINLCRNSGMDDVVFSCLAAEGDIDLVANKYLMSHVKGMSITFHRAFDRCREPGKALKQLITLDFERVFTSRQQPTAEKGIPLLQRLNQLVNGRIKITTGCDVNGKNIARIRRGTGVPAFHLSAREPQTGHMTHSNPSVYMGTEGADEDTIMLTTERRVRDTIDALIGEKT